MIDSIDDAIKGAPSSGAKRGDSILGTILDMHVKTLVILNRQFCSVDTKRATTPNIPGTDLPGVSIKDIYPFSWELLQLALDGDAEGTEFTSNSNGAWALKASAEMEEKIKAVVEMAQKDNVIRYSFVGIVSFYDEGGDLKYSIGDGNYRVEVFSRKEIEKKTGFIWKVTTKYLEYTVEVTVWDTYDFTEKRGGLNPGDILNDWGYDKQQSKELTPFPYNVKYTTKFEVKQ